MTAERTTEARRILALAWPVVLTSLNWTILSITDIAVLGLVGAHEVAAMGASRTLGFIGVVAGLAGLSGILVAASRAEGAGDAVRTGQVLREGLLLALAIGLPAGLVLFAFAEPMLAGIGVLPALVGPAGAVVRTMALAYPLQMLMIAASYFLEGVSRPRRVMTVNLAVLPGNALLAWALSGGHCGLPAWGAVGAATATVIATALGAAGMVGAAFALPDRARRGLGRIRGGWRAALPGAGALARFGAVPAVSAGLELAGFSYLIALSTRLGETATHAFQIVFAVHNVTFAVAIGLGSAAGVRVGNAVGEGQCDAARPRALIAAALAAAATAALAAALFVGAGPLAVAFPATAAVHALAATMLAAWAPFIVFDGIQIVLLYALRSLGDQVVAGASSITAYFVVTGGLGWWLVGAGHGPIALVWASGAGMIAAALLHGARFAVVSRPDRPKSSARAA